MPEFDTNYRCMTITLDTSNPQIAKNLALFTRFETDKNIYDGTVAREKSLRDLTYDPKTDMIMYGKASDLGLAYKDMDVSLYLSIPKQIEIKELNDSFNKKYSEAKNKFIELVKEKKSSYPDNSMMVSYNYFVREMGKYLVEQESSSIYVFISSEKGSKNFQTENTSVYDRKTGKKLRLSDIFINGFDYKQAIIDTVQKRNHKNSYWKLTNQDISNIIDADNFRVNIEDLGMSGVTDKTDGTSNSFFIEYKDLGYENLTIFD